MAYCIKLAMYLPLLHIHYNPYVIGPVTYFLGLGSIFFPKTNAGCGICSNRPSSKHVATTASCQDLQATPSGNVAGSPLLSSIFIEVHRERGDFPPRWEFSWRSTSGYIHEDPTNPFDDTSIVGHPGIQGVCSPRKMPLNKWKIGNMMNKQWIWARHIFGQANFLKRCNRLSYNYPKSISLNIKNWKEHGIFQTYRNSIYIYNSYRRCSALNLFVEQKSFGLDSPAHFESFQ